MLVLAAVLVVQGLVLVAVTALLQTSARAERRHWRGSGPRVRRRRTVDLARRCAPPGTCRYAGSSAVGVRAHR